MESELIRSHLDKTIATFEDHIARLIERLGEACYKEGHATGVTDGYEAGVADGHEDQKRPLSG